MFACRRRQCIDVRLHESTQHQGPGSAQDTAISVHVCEKDVAVDVRAKSVTYGDHVVAELSSQNARQLWIPDGFLHGFITLVDNTEVQYMCTDYYDSKSDGNIIWNDRTLNINWGIMESDAIISDKDMSAPLFKNFRTPFQ